MFKKGEAKISVQIAQVYCQDNFVNVLDLSNRCIVTFSFGTLVFVKRSDIEFWNTIFWFGRQVLFSHILNKHDTQGISRSDFLMLVVVVFKFCLLRLVVVLLKQLIFSFFYIESIECQNRCVTFFLSRQSLRSLKLWWTWWTRYRLNILIYNTKHVNFLVDLIPHFLIQKLFIINLRDKFVF